MGLRAPGAGDTEPGRAPGRPAGSQRHRRRPRALCGGAGGHRKVSLQLGESGRRAVRRASGSGACGAGAGPGRGRAGWRRCVCARGARLDARPSERRVWRRRRWWRGLERRGRGLGERRGRGEPGSGEKLASAWVRADGAGGRERGARRAGGDAGRPAAAGSESPVAAPGLAGPRIPRPPFSPLLSLFAKESSCAALCRAPARPPTPHHFPTSAVSWDDPVFFPPTPKKGGGIGGW